MAIFPIFIPHAGCPHQCVFCNQKTISGEKRTGVEDVVRQIGKYRQWIAPSRSNQAAFYGGSFTGLDMDLQGRLFAPVDELRAAGVIGSVRVSTRPDYIDGPRINLLKRHGVTLVELGVQSLDDRVLEKARRGHTREDVVRAVALLRDAGLSVGLQLMVGMPGQTRESLRETVDEVCRLQPDIARIYPLLVVKGTPLEEQWRQGLFTPLSVEEAADRAAYVYRRLEERGIKVIRIGLQPDEELCRPGNILAGPFHPAMGELVKSRVCRDAVTEVVAELLPEAGEAAAGGGTDVASGENAESGGNPAMEGCCKARRFVILPGRPEITVEVALQGRMADEPVGAVLGSAAGGGPGSGDNERVAKVRISFPVQLESKLRGQKNTNLRYWRERFPGAEIELVRK